MTATKARGDNIALLASNYQQVVGLVTIDPFSWKQIAKANPTRWYLAFSTIQANNVALWPGPPPEAMDYVGICFTTGFTWEVKYKDSPSFATGEWWGLSSIIQDLCVMENNYLR